MIADGLLAAIERELVGAGRGRRAGGRDLRRRRDRPPAGCRRAGGGAGGGQRPPRVRVRARRLAGAARRGPSGVGQGPGPLQPRGRHRDERTTTPPPARPADGCARDRGRVPVRAARAARGGPANARPTTPTCVPASWSARSRSFERPASRPTCGRSRDSTDGRTAPAWPTSPARHAWSSAAARTPRPSSAGCAPAPASRASTGSRSAARSGGTRSAPTWTAAPTGPRP